MAHNIEARGTAEHSVSLWPGHRPAPKGIWWAPSLGFTGAQTPLGPRVAGPQKAEATPARRYEPERYRIYGGLPRGYYLVRAVPARVWIEGSEFVAEQPDLRIHAFGADRVQALLNLGEGLVDQLELLLEAGERLGPALARDREWLKQLVVRGDQY